EEAAFDILGLDPTMLAKPEIKEVASYLAQAGSRDFALTARLLIHELLDLPGPILKPEYAAVAVGVDPQHSHEDDLRRQLDLARYKGAFEDLRWNEERQIPLYWRSSLRDLKGSLSDFTAAQCFICQQAASTLCAECEKPVDGEHSLPVQRGEVTYP